MYDEDATLFGLGALTLGSIVIDLSVLLMAIPAAITIGMLLYRLLVQRGP